MKLSQLGYLQSHGRPLPRYTGPPWKKAEPEKAESACDLIAFYRDWPEVSCSFRTALALSRLHAEWRRRV